MHTSTRTNLSKVAFAGIAAAALFTLMGAQLAFAATTVVVSGDTAAGENQPGWLFNRDTSTATPFEFTIDEASIGTGSLYVLPIDGSSASDKFVGENFLNASVADVNLISYDFMIGNGGTAADANEFYMNVYANFAESDDDKFYDCRYNVVPTVGTVGAFTTVTFDPTEAYPVTTRGSSPYTCPPVPADMDTVDTVDGEANIRMFSLNVGDTSASDAGLDGYLDNVVVDMDSGVTVYDFEMDRNGCKNGEWEDFGFKNQGQCMKFMNTGKDSR